MKWVEDECVGCDVCIGCRKGEKRVTFTCDKCGADGAVYTDSVCDLCIDCLAKEYHDDLIDWLKSNDILAEWAEDYRKEE